MTKNIGFVCFRLAGTDGVSLETRKWSEVLSRMGFECYYLGGELDTPEKRSLLCELCHFKHPEILEIQEQLFQRQERRPELTSQIHNYREKIKSKIYSFIQKYDIDLLITENVFAIPINVPFSLALTDVIAEAGISTLAHHHDFFWERKRFLQNCIWDFINASFPPHMPAIKHVVINTSAKNQLALRTGIGATLIPNVMEYENPPSGIDDYNSDVRETLGVNKDQIFLLQPTRVVQRKGIEHSIEFAARLGEDTVLVISHASGDEGDEYQNRVIEYARLLDVKALFVDDIISSERGETSDGRKIYSIADVYPHADMVTYPSVFEGFGNAFLEAVYFRKPILVNNYSIYSHDIKPKGFEVIEIEDYITSQTVDHAMKLLNNPAALKKKMDKNYKLGLKYYSYQILKNELNHLITAFWGAHRR